MRKSKIAQDARKAAVVNESSGNMIVNNLGIENSSDLNRPDTISNPSQGIILSDGFDGNSNLPALGSDIIIRGHNGKYVTDRTLNNTMYCNSDMPVPFTIIDIGSDSIAIRNMNNQFLQVAGNGILYCNSSGNQDASDWFKWKSNEDGTFSICSFSGKFISAENGSDPMSCTRDSPEMWERFTWEQSPTAQIDNKPIATSSNSATAIPTPVSSANMTGGASKLWLLWYLLAALLIIGYIKYGRK